MTRYRKKGGGCNQVSDISQTCNQSVDITQYTQPCSSLPLDNTFQTKRGGSCQNLGKDCLGNNITQLGQVPTDPSYPKHYNMSEPAFKSRYFANKTTYKQTGKGYFPNVSSEKIGGLPEITPYFDCNKPKYHPKQALFTSHKINQTGGAYLYIINPKSNRKVSIYGKTGKRVLKNYLKMIGGSGEALLNQAHIGKNSNFDSNMNNRTFDCNQPDWCTDCV